MTRSLDSVLVSCMLLVEGVPYANQDFMVWQGGRSLDVQVNLMDLHSEY